MFKQLSRQSTKKAEALPFLIFKQIPSQPEVCCTIRLSVYVIGTFYFALKSLGYSEIESVLASLSGILIALVVGLTVGGIFGVPFITAPVIILLVYKSKEWRTQTSADSSSTIVQDEIE